MTPASLIPAVFILASILSAWTLWDGWRVGRERVRAILTVLEE